VHGIVKQAGGAVAVKSEPGRGTSFTIFLPSARDEREAAASGGELPRGRESILLVEDEPQLRESASRALTSCGYDVVAVPDGDAAGVAAASASVPFDLLITDLVLPRTGGREVAAKLRTLWPSLRVLCIAHDGDDSPCSDVLSSGDSWLAKPFTASDLACRVREILDA
jgi:DNA-binding response OmpR family regulator